MTQASPIGRDDVVLRVEHLTVEYRTSTGPHLAVRDVTFDVRAGGAFGVVGESGSGKSTLALAIMRYFAPGATVRSGRVMFQGQDLLRSSADALRRLRGDRIAIVFQDPFSALNPTLRVGDQVAEVLEVHRGRSRREALDEATDLFAQVHLPDPGMVARKFPYQLSGGQQQRVVIAMALACNPVLLLLDEPTTGLDVTTEAQILDLISELRHEFRSAILYISHNLAVVSKVCDLVGVMYAGQLVEVATTKELFGHPRHPYTQGLLACVPRLGRPMRLQPILGRLPRPGMDLPGCLFEPRCAHARDECRQALPPLSATAPGHAVRCVRWEQIANGPIAQEPASRLLPREGNEVILSAVHLRRYYREAGSRLLFFGRDAPLIKAVEDVSLDLRRGETLAVVGESGSGKTTLARIVVGLLAQDAGELRFGGTVLPRAAARRPRSLRRQIQMVFQNPESSLNPRHRVGRTLMRPLQLFGLARGREQRPRALELLRLVRLDAEYFDRYPALLSGGEKQRVAIARALAPRPTLIVCDEPLSALDVSVQASLLNTLRDLQAESDVAYIFISHDLAVVRHLAHRVMVMYLGMVCEVGPNDAFFAAPFHPYTWALLSAVPAADPETKPDQPKVRLVGSIPRPSDPPTGCRFNTRCPLKLGDICERESPPARSPSPGHTIYCHQPLEVLAQLKVGDIPSDIVRGSEKALGDSIH